MASLKAKYDEDLIKILTGEATGITNTSPKPKEPATHMFDKIKAPDFMYDDKNVPFSSLFWEPENIPDVPVKLFKEQDWDEKVRHLIPNRDPYWVWNRPVTEAFALAMFCGDTTLLHGWAGTGKTQLPVQWAALTNTPAHRMSCHRETREAHFLGSPGIEYDEEGKPSIKQEPTALTESLRYGGIFIEDEAFRHDSALVLQSLREKSNRTVVLPEAPGLESEDRVLKAPAGRWWYVLTDNTTGTGDTTGIFIAEVQDASSLDRIDAAIEVPYLSPKDEKDALATRSSLQKGVTNKMVVFANFVRAEFQKGALSNTISMRGLMAWAEKTEITQSVEKGLHISWYDKLPNEDKAVVEDLYSQKMDGRSIRGAFS